MSETSIIKNSVKNQIFIILLLSFSFLFLITSVSAGSLIIKPSNNTVNANNSNCWLGHCTTDGGWLTGINGTNFITDFNSTQMSNVSGILNILESWLRGVITGYGYITSEANWNANSSSVTRIGNCPSGQVVQNTTTSGVQCVAMSSPSGSMDYTNLMLNNQTNTPSSDTVYDLGSAIAQWFNGFFVNLNVSSNITTTNIISTDGAMWQCSNSTDIVIGNTTGECT